MNNKKIYSLKKYYRLLLLLHTDSFIFYIYFFLRERKSKKLFPPTSPQLVAIYIDVHAHTHTHPASVLIPFNSPSSICVRYGEMH